MTKAYILLTLLILSMFVVACSQPEVQEELPAEEPEEIEEQPEAPTLADYSLEEIQQETIGAGGKDYRYKQVSASDDYKQSMFKYETILDVYDIYKSNPVEDFLILKAKDDSMPITTFNDLDEFKDFIITNFIDHNAYVMRDIAEEPYETNLDIFTQEIGAGNQNALRMTFAERAYREDGSARYFDVDDRIIIPCGEDTIIIMKVQIKSKGVTYYGSVSKADALAQLRNDANYELEHNTRSIEKMSRFCAAALPDDFFASTIRTQHKNKVLNSFSVGSSIDIQFQQGFPDDYYNEFVKKQLAGANVLFFSLTNKGAPIERPLIHVTAKYGHKTEEFSDNPVEYRTGDKIESFFELPADAEVTITAGVYDSWSKFHTYQEKTAKFD
ncbi:hypothetical protein KY326_04840 [Candidatus Woesearchaeota archaeon]|nr:hypothetical protein [Candidatus Woesearchaeota archaeon]